MSSIKKRLLIALVILLAACACYCQEVFSDGINTFVVTKDNQNLTLFWNNQAYSYSAYLPISDGDTILMYYSKQYGMITYYKMGFAANGQIYPRIMFNMGGRSYTGDYQVAAAVPAPSSGPGTYSSPSPQRAADEWKMCPSCYGTGICNYCHGSGTLHAYGNVVPCPNCDYDHNGKCSKCHGTGKIRKDEY